MDRAPAVSGRFYPADETELESRVSGFIGPSPEDEDAIAVVAPHAGYRFSGAIAGEVFAKVRVPRAVVLLGPNHTGTGARAAIMTHGAWRLPGKHVPIDTTVAEDLRRGALLTEDHEAHAHEHSLEVEIPFLLARNSKVRIVPVCLGLTPYASCVRIGNALADLVASHGRDVLIVASTDMSHYLPADTAEKKDRLALERIEALDAEGLYETVVSHEISMCGFIPTTVALVAAKALGASEAKLVRYGNSGHASGDYNRVVGYAGFVIR